MYPEAQSATLYKGPAQGRKKKDNWVPNIAYFCVMVLRTHCTSTITTSTDCRFFCRSPLQPVLFWCLVAHVRPLLCLLLRCSTRNSSSMSSLQISLYGITCDERGTRNRCIRSHQKRSCFKKEGTAEGGCLLPKHKTHCLTQGSDEKRPCVDSTRSMQTPVCTSALLRLQPGRNYH